MVRHTACHSVPLTHLSDRQFPSQKAEHGVHVRTVDIDL